MTSRDNVISSFIFVSDGVIVVLTIPVRLNNQRTILLPKLFAHLVQFVAQFENVDPRQIVANEHNVVAAGA